MTIPVGAQAPDFELKDNHGAPVRLSDFRGRKNVVLLFYPFAFTGVCTGELSEIRDRLEQFSERDAEVLAVSNDSIHTLRVFGEQEDLPFPLLSDFWPHGDVSRAYGVFDEDKGCAVRGTFVIDRQGVVRATVSSAMADARDPGEYLAALDTL
ncbi:peroxiredoxin [Streptomyces cellulosae]|jgi:peroxiredoxin|uniref:thioredoxin-dependent peroxiredoxin n=1 Tax=Streptomyces thermocarboxydus TaxID=59299 RepID=A0ABU3J121_9ACTN|nr:peroxiredoxin [Streptomyces cellulosae]MDT6968764.1 peroxiredoxin [Streptomyces thermocarboxydus]MXQ58755.1 redoxin domain-containing protein [Streptomyces sp. XHT-2]MYW52970.1 redoxin domain-containing protein [Streptomyces sp. SID8376]THC50638.1 peroxiredoxin [Streptomyces sp. Akac8]